MKTLKVDINRLKVVEEDQILLLTFKKATYIGYVDTLMASNITDVVTKKSVRVD